MYSVQQERKDKADKTLNAFCLEVERIASLVLDDKIFLHVTQDDKIKLYQLQIWSWRYKVPLDFIVSSLLAFWKDRLPRNFKRRRGSLGLRIGTLVGQKSKDYLLAHIAESFPNYEHEAEWKVKNIMALVPSAGDDDIVALTPERFMSAYIARIKQSRRRIEKAREKFSRRAFRDNPFLS